jgi:hypothetical protein
MAIDMLTISECLNMIASRINTKGISSSRIVIPKVSSLGSSTCIHSRYTSNIHVNLYYVYRLLYLKITSRVLFG